MTRIFASVLMLLLAGAFPAAGEPWVPLCSAGACRPVSDVIESGPGGTPVASAPAVLEARAGSSDPRAPRSDRKSMRRIEMLAGRLMRRLIDVVGDVKDNFGRDKS